MDITELLAFGVQQGASDLHLSAGLPPMIRVDGDIRRVDLPPQNADRGPSLNLRHYERSSAERI